MSGKNFVMGKILGEKVVEKWYDTKYDIYDREGVLFSSYYLEVSAWIKGIIAL